MKRAILHMDADPEELSYEDEARAVVSRALETLAQELGVDISVNVLLSSPERIRELNSWFRQKDEVTDVLSFPEYDYKGLFTDWYKVDGRAEIELEEGRFVQVGDIAICVQRAQEQADSLGHSLMREIQFLSVHGALHLLGYDHVKAADEERMTALQRRIMSKIGDA